MYYYLATKGEDGTWSFWLKEGQLSAMDQAEAREDLALAINVHGLHNVKLFKAARFSVEMTIEIKE